MDEIGSFDEFYDFKRLSPHSVSMTIRSVDNHSLGAYGCYVHTSVGTFREVVFIKRERDSVRLVVKRKKFKRRIELTVEQGRWSEPMVRDHLVIGEGYQFDCITGE